MKPSAFRMFAGGVTLTNPTPSCFRNSNSSAVGAPDDCAQILMPPALAGIAAASAPPIKAAPPSAILPNSRRPSLKSDACSAIRDLDPKSHVNRYRSEEHTSELQSL